MLRHARSLKYNQVGLRRFFDNEERNSFFVSSLIEGRMGFFLSLRPASWKDGLPSLTINLNSKSMDKFPILHLMPPL